MIDYMLRGVGQLSSMVAFVRWANPDIEDKGRACPVPS